MKSLFETPALLIFIISNDNPKDPVKQLSRLLSRRSNSLIIEENVQRRLENYLGTDSDVHPTNSLFFVGHSHDTYDPQKRHVLDIHGNVIGPDWFEASEDKDRKVSCFFLVCDGDLVVKSYRGWDFYFERIYFFREPIVLCLDTSYFRWGIKRLLKKLLSVTRNIHDKDKMDEFIYVLRRKQHRLKFWVKLFPDRLVLLLTIQKMIDNLETKEFK